MPAGYTYAVQFGPTGMDKVNAVKELLRQGSTRHVPSDNTTYDCVWYQANKAMRLVKVHDLLITLASSQAGYNPATKAQVLSDLISSNLGYVADVTAANTTFRVCGTARQLLLAGLQSNGLDSELEALLSMKASIDKTGILNTWSRETGAKGGYCKWRQIDCINGTVVNIMLYTDTGVEGLQGSLPPAVALHALRSLATVFVGNQPGITGTLPAD